MVPADGQGDFYQRYERASQLRLSSGSHLPSAVWLERAVSAQRPFKYASDGTSSCHGHRRVKLPPHQCPHVSNAGGSPSLVCSLSSPPQPAKSAHACRNHKMRPIEIASLQHVHSVSRRDAWFLWFLYLLNRCRFLNPKRHSIQIFYTVLSGGIMVQRCICAIPMQSIFALYLFFVCLYMKRFRVLLTVRPILPFPSAESNIR
jgi:hypothetical protein